MWELRKNSAHGRISVRRFSLVATAVMVAMFALTSLLSPQALAADATRDGDKVTYDGRTYAPMTDAERPTGIQRDVTGYASLDEANKKAHFIFTTGDVEKATTGQYVIYDFTPPANFSNSSPPITVAIADVAPTGTGSTNANTGTTGCNGQFMQGVGWILCPVVNFLASGMDHLYDILSSFLVVQPAQSNADSSLFKIWSIVRNIANICFVIGFLVVIFSQVSGVGITNYGIKRVMPRLILAAILVNISFWVCALAIDLSNTLGYGVHSLFMGVFDSLNTAGAYQQNITWTSVASTILSGTAVAGLAAYGIYGSIAATAPSLLITFIPTLLGVMISALVALLVVSVRQALIVCLVIISPLAFVAFLLPNTEKYFTKWRELFMTLLLVYPIFAVVFGGSQLAGMAIIQNANGSLSLIILGMAVQIAPVVITPLLVKVSGSMISNITGIVNNPNKGIMDKTRNWADGRAAEAKARRLSDTRRNGWTTRLSRAANDRKRLHEGLRKEYESSDDNRFARTNRGTRLETMRRTNANVKQHGENEYSRSGDGMRLERESKRLGVVKNDIDTETMNGQEGYALRKLMSDSDAYKTESENAFNSHDLGQQARGRRDMAEVGKTRADNKYNKTSIGKEVDMARRDVERKKQKIGANLEHDWHFRNLTDQGSQEREMKLRTAVDRAAGAKAETDAVYTELKAGKTTMLSDKIAQKAYEVAEHSTLTASRNSQAAGELRTKINDSLQTNAQTYQRDAAGEIVLDAAGKRIVLGQRRMSGGQTLQEYATGIGKRETMFANAIAEERSEWSKQANAAGELIAHFKLDSDAVQKLARNGEGTTVTVQDDNGNDFSFDAGDEYVKEAAIVKQFKEGSYGQKMQILKETGREVKDVDAAGNTITRKGYNYSHRATVKNEAVASGIAKLAPFINDITYNELLKGNFNGDDSLNMHALRQIFEGRIKVDNLSDANNEAIDVMGKVGSLYKSSDPADQAQFARYKDQMFDLFGGMYGTDSDRYRDLVAGFDAQFNENFDSTLNSLKQIMENTNLSRGTSVTSRKSIAKMLDDNSVTYRQP